MDTCEYKFIENTDERYKISKNGIIIDILKNKSVSLDKSEGKRTYVKLYFSDGTNYKVKVEKLVYETFVRKLIKGEYIIHKDKNIQNYKLENLDIQKTKSSQKIKQLPDNNNSNWKFIDNTNNRYKISKDGNVIDVIDNRIIKQNNKGNTRRFSVKIQFYNNPKKTYITVDKLVYETFIRKLEKNEVVVHKDKNIHNNNLDNLIIKKANEARYIEEPPTLENEKWKYIKNYENRYMISTKGRVYSQLTNEIMEIYLGEIEYYVINLVDEKGKRDLYLVHILVAENFIGEIPKKHVVDHKDRNKLNNDIDNLQIVTRSVNGKNRDFKTLNTIQKFDLNNNLIKEYDSFKELLLDLDIKSSRSIYKCLNGDQATSHGFKWKYKDKKEIISLDDNFVKLGQIKGVDFNNYGINKKAQIYSYHTNKIMKSFQLGGYESINLMVNGKQYNLKVHRLLTHVFGNETYDSKLVVNHIDEDKLNNDLENLEYITHKQNSKHSRAKKVKQIDKETDECIKIFDSVNDAFDAINIKYGSHIRKVCNGERKTAYGYKWEWA